MKGYRELDLKNVSATLQKVVTRLECNGIEYALCGGMALANYVEPRFTLDIDLLVYQDKKESTLRLILDSGFSKKFDHEYQTTVVDQKTRIEVDLLFVETDPEWSAIDDSQRVTFLDVELNCSKPRYLLWMYCNSDQSRHEQDARNLIASKLINISELMDLMELVDDTHAIECLRKLYERK